MINENLPFPGEAARPRRWYERFGIRACSYLRDIHPYLGDTRQWRLRWRRFDLRVSLFSGPEDE